MLTTRHLGLVLGLVSVSCGSASRSSPDASTNSADGGTAVDAAGAADGAAPIDANPIDAPPCPVAYDDTLTATLAITADDYTSVYVNGTNVYDLNELWSAPRQLTVTLYRHPARANVIAVETENAFAINGFDRGLVADLRYTIAPDSTVHTLVTDVTWKVSPTMATGWSEVAHDDSAWPAATVLGTIGMAPWFDVFSSLAPGSAASWLWLYDSNVPTSDKPNAEFMYARRTFYIGLDGAPSNSQVACP